jgi:hypothetical protein
VSNEKANQQVLMDRFDVLLAGYLPDFFHFLPIIGSISILVDSLFKG